MRFARTLVTVAVALAATIMTACGGNNTAATTANTTPPASNPPVTSPGNPGSTTTPPVSGAQSLDTAAVLAQARQTSETASPYAVNSGALTLTDTSDTTQAIKVN